MTTNNTSRKLRVLQSFRSEELTTGNPFLNLSISNLKNSIEPLFFSWKTALLGQYDVLHLHLPDHLVRRRRTHGIPSSMWLALLVARVRIGRIPVVRTVHNLEPHEKIESLLSRRLLGQLDHLTTTSVTLSATTPAVGTSGKVVIPHGHYRDHYEGAAGTAQQDGRLLFFGMIRAYKGVPQLIDVFCSIADESLSLHLCGAASDPTLIRTIEQKAVGDPRIRLLLRHASDEELRNEIGEAELVVLPYREMHNSGALLLALSLDRPVLAPWSESNALLSEEVGPGWIVLYRGAFTASTVTNALGTVRARVGDRPDLSARDWPQLGAALSRVYEVAAARRSWRRAR